MQHSKEAKEKAWKEQQAAAEKRRAMGIAARAKAKRQKRGPKKEPMTRDPISVSVKEALRLVPMGRSKLFEALKNGTIKSRLVNNTTRAINYRSLVEAFEPLEGPFVPTAAEAEEIAKDAANAE